MSRGWTNSVTSFTNVYFVTFKWSDCFLVIDPAVNNKTANTAHQCLDSYVRAQVCLLCFSLPLPEISMPTAVKHKQQATPMMEEGKKKSHISLKYFSSFQQNNKVRKVDKWWCENMLFGEWDVKKNWF